MARKRAKISYFPLDVDMVYDIKVRKLMKRKGQSGAFVYITLLQHIYKNGYYLHLGEDELFYIADAVYGEEKDIKEIIEACVDIKLFDRKMYEEHSILTSASVQMRYQEMRRRMKSLPEIQEYNLLEADKEDSTEAEGSATPETPSAETSAAPSAAPEQSATQTPQKETAQASDGTSPQSPTPPPTGSGNTCFKKDEFPQMGEGFIEGCQMMLKRLGQEVTADDIKRHYEEFIARERVTMSADELTNERDWFIHFRNYIITKYRNTKNYENNSTPADSDKYKARRGVDKAYHTDEEYKQPFI